MHIVFLTDNFPPERNAPASRTYEHAREWVNHGHRVTVITCFPNFPSGKVFAGYKNRLFHKEIIDGIEILRVWSYMTANSGFVYRIIDYLSFMVSSLVASIFVRNIDVIVGTSPQFFTACSAYLSSILRRKPWFFEVRDLWPASIKAVGAMQNNFILGLLEKVEIFLYHRATHIICVTDSHRKNLSLRGIDNEKISVITNGVDLSLFEAMPKDDYLIKKYNLKDFFIVGYIGTIGMAHDLITIMRGAKLLQENFPNEKIKLIFLGEGAEKLALEQYREAEQLNNVIFLDSIQRSEIPKFYSILDVFLVHLKNEKIFEEVIPSKMFEALGMGVPLIHGVQGESQKIVEEMEIGVCFSPGNEDDFVDKLIELRRDTSRRKKMSENSLVGAHRYDRRNLSLRMLDILENSVHERC